MVGGTGNDTYLVDDAGDILVEAATGGTDTVRSSVASFTLANNLENLVYTGTGATAATGNGAANAITGGLGNDTLNGAAGNDTLNGAAGNDILEGGAGTDNLVGGAGNDTYIVDSTTDRITELAAEGTDTVQSSVTFSLAALANVENLTLTGATAINGTGNAGANLITGNGAANILDGGAGSDTLTGGLGADTFRVAALTNSLITAMDSVTDFVIGTDVFDGPVAVTAANISKVIVANVFSAATIGTALTNTNFGANRAALLTFTDGTYLALNNATAGWNATTDAVLKFAFTGTANSFAIV
jgi:Ca2+-binding RTX toxin-like protein